MIRWRPSGLSIFSQTLLLLLASLVVSQLVSITMFLSFSPPRPDFNRLSDIAEALSLERPERGGRERALSVRLLPDAPAAKEGMTSDPLFTERLADRLDVPEANVRLYFEPDQRGGFGNEQRRKRRLVPMRRGEPLFFDTVVAGLDTGAGWRVVQTPPRSWISQWQKRMVLWFGVSALLLLPFAWFFARRLTRPIRRFAEAADRMGGDPYAPSVPDEGPAELRVTAHALNRMQQRLADYVSERTAMIGAIAHDLRTPLARIAFRIEAAPDDVRDKVQADIEQMRAMISATIGFVRGASRAVEPVAVDLAAIVERLVAEERDMGRAVSLGRADSLMITGDPISLARLFQNLLDNGVAYGAEVTVSVEREGDRALVRFADRGPGLPDELIERVFHPFERGDPSRNRETGGIGLGLTIARSIAQEHGGALTLVNRPGGGLDAICAFPIRA